MKQYIVRPLTTGFFSGTLNELKLEAFLNEHAAQGWRFVKSIHETKKILGIFARLIVRHGKPRYRAFMPRVWRHLNANLTRPGLEPVRDWSYAHVPETSRQ